MDIREIIFYTISFYLNVVFWFLEGQSEMVGNWNRRIRYEEVQDNRNAQGKLPGFV